MTWVKTGTASLIALVADLSLFSTAFGCLDGENLSTWAYLFQTKATRTDIVVALQSVQLLIAYGLSEPRQKGGKLWIFSNDLLRD